MEIHEAGRISHSTVGPNSRYIRSEKASQSSLFTFGHGSTPRILNMLSGNLLQFAIEHGH